VLPPLLEVATAVAEVEATVEDTMAVGEEAMEVDTTADGAATKVVEVDTRVDAEVTTVAATIADRETTLLLARPTHLEATTQRTGTTDEGLLHPGVMSTTLAGPTRGGLGIPYLSERGMSRRLVSAAALLPLAAETTGSKATSRHLCPSPSNENCTLFKSFLAFDQKSAQLIASSILV
jgi:hypothetical protein